MHPHQPTCTVSCRSMSRTLAMAASMWCSANSGPEPGLVTSSLGSDTHIHTRPRAVHTGNENAACKQIGAAGGAPTANDSLQSNPLVVVLQEDGGDGACWVGHEHGPSVATHLVFELWCCGGGNHTHTSRSRGTRPLSARQPCHTAAHATLPHTASQPRTPVKKGSAPTWSRWKWVMNTASTTLL
jgi:hypothetical protein